MADNMTMQQLRGTAAALRTNNPVPLAGQIVFESDTNKIKVGDGKTHYNSLEYLAGGTAVSNDLGLVRDNEGYLCQTVEEDEE